MDLKVVTPSAEPDTLLHVILDRSGSMNSIRDTTIEGYNAYLQTMQQDNKGITHLSLTLFDSSYVTTQLHPIHKNLSVEKVPVLTRNDYQPTGGTPLYDAVGQIITQIDSDIAVMKVKPAVLVVIITDGQNTDNRGFTAGQVREMITQRSEAGWTFVYLGANQDAWSVGQTMGLNVGNVKTYDTRVIRDTFTEVAYASSTYRNSNVNLRASGLAGAGSAQYATTSFFEDAKNAVNTEEEKEDKKE